MGSVWIAFGLTLLAGLSTGIGSALVFFTKRTNPTFLAVSLGFSAGVMIYVSFVEIFPSALESVSKGYADTPAVWITTAAFFGGILLIALLDKLVPANANPHEVPALSEQEQAHLGGKRSPAAAASKPAKHSVTKHAFAASRGISHLPTQGTDHALMHMGLFTALAIAIHNFPEGFATFLSGMQSAQLAIPVTVAIAIHNIPEGIAVAVPVYYATGSRRKGFWLSFASGLAEPLGALICWLVLGGVMNDVVFGAVFAAVAGIMVFISLDELLPTAEVYGEHHHAIYGLIAGMAVMALSLLMLG